MWGQKGTSHSSIHAEAVYSLDSSSNGQQYDLVCRMAAILSVLCLAVESVALPARLLWVSQRQRCTDSANYREQRARCAQTPAVQSGQ